MTYYWPIEDEQLLADYLNGTVQLNFLTEVSSADTYEIVATSINDSIYYADFIPNYYSNGSGFIAEEDNDLSNSNLPSDLLTESSDTAIGEILTTADSQFKLSLTTGTFKTSLDGYILVIETQGRNEILRLAFDDASDSLSTSSSLIWLIDSSVLDNYLSISLVIRIVAPNAPVVQTTPNTFLVLTHLRSNTEYDITITAKNAAYGISGINPDNTYSTVEFVASTLPTSQHDIVLTAPSGIVLFTDTTSTIQVAWQPVIDATSYEIRYRFTSFSPWYTKRFYGSNTGIIDMLPASVNDSDAFQYYELTDFSTRILPQRIEFTIGVRSVNGDYVSEWSDDYTTSGRPVLASGTVLPNIIRHSAVIYGTTVRASFVSDAKVFSILYRLGTTEKSLYGLSLGDEELVLDSDGNYSGDGILCDILEFTLDVVTSSYDSGYSDNSYGSVSDNVIPGWMFSDGLSGRLESFYSDGIKFRIRFDSALHDLDNYKMVITDSSGTTVLDILLSELDYHGTYLESESSDYNNILSTYGGQNLTVCITGLCHFDLELEDDSGLDGLTSLDANHYVLVCPLTDSGLGGQPLTNNGRLWTLLIGNYFGQLQGAN